MKKQLERIARWGLLFLPLLAGQVHAGEDDALRLSGFGTLGYAQDNRQDLATSRDISQKPKEGYKSGPSWLMDTRLGMQLEYRLNPSAELVGQAVMSDRVDAGLNSSIEMAYLGLKPSAQLGVRVGRVGYDAFLMSDHRNVGYAYSWVRPPSEFYGWIPIFSVDGLDTTYRIDTGDAFWSVKAQAGASRIGISLGSQDFNFVTNTLWSLSASRQTDLWRIKAAYSEFSVDSEVSALNPMHAGLGQLAAATAVLLPRISAEAADLNRQLFFKGSKISYATIGAAYDDGAWFAQTELGHATASASIGTQGDMAYLSLGRRWGDWAPYVRYSTAKHGNASATAKTDWGVIAQQNLQSKIYDILNSTQIEQRTLTLGMRWDFNKQAALKLQWDATTVLPYGYVLWSHAPSVNNRQSRVNQISATLDFVF